MEVGMARIRELLNGRETFLVQSEITAKDAAEYMLDKNVGAVPVINGTELVGVLSERDLVRRILMQGKDWTRTKVSEVMTPDPLTVTTNEDLQECMVLMKRHGFRHLPVCDDGKLEGFVSMRDLLLHDLDEKEIEVRMMRSYIASGGE
jgi:CBS domain-containing protein